tara:strand:+ start:393 stop:530 length:138 start_codon:yes stop_codon:yes gene_type:complete
MPGPLPGAGCRVPGITGPLLDFDVQRDDIRTKSRLSSSWCPFAVP